MKNNHVYSLLYYHLIWKTSDKKPVLTESIRLNLFKYISKTMSMKDWHVIAIGGIEDHIHILLQKRPQHAIPYVVSIIKSSSSKFLKENFIPNFEWQRGYGVFTVDKKSLEIVKNYILNQEAHHKK
jgi:REP element-mobilizing transposase RayT